MSSRVLSGVTVECCQGDIAAQYYMDAVVNAANAHLRPGGGVAGALHRAAGPGLERECSPLAPIAPGQAVITGGHNLPNRHVIHCLGPVYGQDEPAAELLGSCYREALRLAEQNGIESIVFPAISTGVFGYPLEEAASVALSSVADQLSELRQVHHVRFVLHDPRSLKAHEDCLQRLT